MTRLKGMRNTQDEWMQTYGHMDDNPETWVTFKGMRWLQVLYETDEEVIRELIPPPLEYAGTKDRVPIVLAYLFDCPTGGIAVGPPSADIRGHKEFAIFVGPTKCKGLNGTYNAAMYVGSDDHMMSGREFHGCPKKIANIKIERCKDSLYASVERNNITFLTIKAKISSRQARPFPKETTSFTLKAFPSAGNGGFDVAKILRITAKNVAEPGMELGGVEVVYKESPFDPLYEIPVRKVLAAAYSEDFDVAFHGEDLAECDPDVIREYLLFRYK